MNSYNAAFGRTIEKLFEQIEREERGEGYTIGDVYSQLVENTHPALRLHLITVGPNAGKLTLEQLCGKKWQVHPHISPVKIASSYTEAGASLLRKPDSYKDSDSRSFYPL